MRKFGLIGKALDHSWSKDYFTELFRRNNLTDCLFENYPMEDLGSLREMIGRDQELSGLCVTVPFKIDIINYLDETDKTAAAAGAVNCIHISRITGSLFLKGYNSDSGAFRESLIPFLAGQKAIKALILGTGGAARAVSHALKEMAIQHSFVSRHVKAGELTYDDLDGAVISDHRLIINATPAGMYPEMGQLPRIPYEHLDSRHILYDLVYNPAVSKFILKGMESGAKTKNGLEMLHRQAEMNWNIWNEGRDVTFLPGVPPQW